VCAEREPQLKLKLSSRVAPWQGYEYIFVEWVCEWKLICVCVCECLATRWFLTITFLTAQAHQLDESNCEFKCGCFSWDSSAATLLWLVGEDLKTARDLNLKIL